MWITYDPSKRDQTLARFICYGMLQNRMVVVGYTPRGTSCHVFSMRKANEREKKRFGPALRK
jgi:uncharacterized DUF497 family protein